MEKREGRSPEGEGRWDDELRVVVFTPFCSKLPLKRLQLHSNPLYLHAVLLKTQHLDILRGKKSGKDEICNIQCKLRMEKFQ